MGHELSYLNSEGVTIFTSHFHKRRGYCCESFCLHCPYGFTLKKIGLVVSAANWKDDLEATSILKQELFDKGDDGGAHESYSIRLKGYLCGFLLIRGFKKELILVDEFKNQGITIEIVEKEMRALNIFEGPKD
jgi:hypothetical protein